MGHRAWDYRTERADYLVSLFSGDVKTPTKTLQATRKETLSTKSVKIWNGKALNMNLLQESKWDQNQSISMLGLNRHSCKNDLWQRAQLCSDTLRYTSVKKHTWALYSAPFTPARFRALWNPHLWTANLIIVTNHQTVGEYLRVTLACRSQHICLNSSTSAWGLSCCILIFERVADFRFHRNTPLCGGGLHLGSNYANRPELTLIHCCVCFSDLPTGTYSTLGVFRFDIFHPASSHY